MRRHRQIERVELGAPLREQPGRLREVLVVHEGPVLVVTREVLDPGAAATTPPEIDPAAVPGPAPKMIRQLCPLCGEVALVSIMQGVPVFACPCVGREVVMLKAG